MAKRITYAPKKEDGKGTIMLIGILLALIIIVGVGLLTIIQQKAPVEPPPEYNYTPPPPDTNLTNVTDTCDEQCMLDAAIAAKNVTLCGELSELQQSCYEQLADDSFDACVLVSDSAKKQDCVTAYAVADGDITICDSLSEDAKTACSYAVDPCADAEDEDLCRALESSDPELCEDKYCLLDYSLENNDSATCDMIVDRVMATACKSTVLDTDKCYDLGEGSLRDYCYELFAIYSEDYLTCTQTTPNSIYALDCFSLYAAHEGNYSICDNDGFELNNRWLCYTNYSLISGDTSGCEAIHELASTNKFRCVFEFAKLYGDPSACDILESSSSRTTCYSGSILYSNENLDWHNCADVVSFNWKNSCYTEAAKLYQDISICDNIEELPEREGCRSSYG